MLFDLTNLRRNGNFGIFWFLGIYQTPELTEKGVIAKAKGSTVVTKKNVQDLHISEKVEALMQFIYTGDNKSGVYAIRPMAYIMSGLTHAFALKTIWLEADARRIVNRINSQWKPDADKKKKRTSTRSLTDSEVRREIRLIQPKTTGITPPDRKKGRLALTSSEEESIYVAVLPPDDDEDDANLMRPIANLTNLHLSEQEQPDPNAIVENIVGDNYADWVPDLIAVGMVPQPVTNDMIMVPDEALPVPEFDGIAAEEQQIADTAAADLPQEEPAAQPPYIDYSSSDGSVTPFVAAKNQKNKVTKKRSASGGGSTSSSDDAFVALATISASQHLLFENLPDIEAATGDEQQRARGGKKKKTFWLSEDDEDSKMLDTERMREMVETKPNVCRMDVAMRVPLTREEMGLRNQGRLPAADLLLMMSRMPAPHAHPQAFQVAPIDNEIFRRKRREAKIRHAGVVDAGVVRQTAIDHIEEEDENNRLPDMPPMDIVVAEGPQSFVEEYEFQNQQVADPEAPPLFTIEEEGVGAVIGRDSFVTAAASHDSGQKRKSEVAIEQPPAKSNRLEKTSDGPMAMIADNTTGVEDNNNEQLLGNRLNEMQQQGVTSTTFKDLFPPQTTTRKQAAMAFFELITQKEALGVRMTQESSDDGDDTVSIKPIQIHLLK